MALQVSIHVQTFVLLLITIEDVLIDRLALLLVEFRRVNSRAATVERCVLQIHRWESRLLAGCVHVLPKFVFNDPHVFVRINTVHDIERYVTGNALSDQWHFVLIGGPIHELQLASLAPRFSHHA